MMNDAQFKIFSDMLNQRFIDLGIKFDQAESRQSTKNEQMEGRLNTKIEQTEGRLTSSIDKRPSKAYLWRICASLTVIALVAGMAGAHPHELTGIQKKIIAVDGAVRPGLVSFALGP